MGTETNAIKYALKYLEEVRRSNIRIDRAYLFGSYAKGKQQPHSDIDVAIISQDFSDNRYDNWNKLSKANIKYYKVEPHPFSKNRYENGDPFIDEIKKTGIVISPES
jgi:predicted nucleotidyltransferase